MAPRERRGACALVEYSMVRACSLSVPLCVGAHTARTRARRTHTRAKANTNHNTGAAQGSLSLSLSLSLSYRARWDRWTP